jgi:Tfp pilus assembly protein PilO
MNFNVSRIWPPRTPTAIAQLGLLLMLAANLAAVYFVWRPIGGSPAELEQQVAELRARLAQQRALLDRTRQNVRKVEVGRNEGDSFLRDYFLNERTAYSAILDELQTAEKESKMRPKDHALSAAEPIEGSDNLAMLTVTANCEGTYPQLIDFINRLDRSSRLLIIESLNATPQQNGSVLSVNMKLNAFVRGDVAQ